MNSQWPITPLPKAPLQYDATYMNQLLKALEDTFRRIQAKGVIEAQRINISELPTATTGLRVGDLWNDSGTVKVVT